MTEEQCRPVTVEVNGEEITVSVRAEQPMSEEGRAGPTCARTADSRPAPLLTDAAASTPHPTRAAWPAPTRTTRRGADVHPATTEILRYFEFGHLPPHLQEISKPFRDLAHAMALGLDGPELTVGLRKLLEAKDCMVRAALPKTND